MFNSDKIKYFLSRSPLKYSFYFMVLSWTLVIFGMVYWLVEGINSETEKSALKEAYKGYEKDMMFRSWTSAQGGLYVPVTKETRPNPYLSDIPERDITTPSGKILTLMNPDEITRQVHELSDSNSAIRGHITSLNPFRKENKADKWETNAMMAFTKGTKSVSGFDTLNNEKYLRYMAPLIATDDCLKCHAVQGYKKGDIIGGISSSVSWTGYEASITHQTSVVYFGYGLLWIIGLIQLSLVRKRFSIYIEMRDRDDLEMKKMNEELYMSKSMVEENLYQNNMLIEELTYTKEKLEKINSEKDKFFSIIAHDLRSPFQGFLGLTETMAADIESFSSSDLAEISSEMHKSANNLFKLLKNLLEWAQVHNGIINFSPKKHSLKEAAKHSIEQTELRASQKNITIQDSIPDSIYVYVDENMLETVLRNLFSNAVKFTSTYGKIEISAVETDNGMIEISIADSGTGISEEEVNNLFRLDKKVSHKGTEGEESCGLGLLLCKEFVEKNEGTIWVESSIGKGSTFYFTLKNYNLLS